MILPCCFRENLVAVMEPIATIKILSSLHYPILEQTGTMSRATSDSIQPCQNKGFIQILNNWMHNFLQLVIYLTYHYGKSRRSCTFH